MIKLTVTITVTKKQKTTKNEKKLSQLIQQKMILTENCLEYI